MDPEQQIKLTGELAEQDLACTLSKPPNCPKNGGHLTPGRTP